LGPINLSERMPMLVLRQGTIVLEERGGVAPHPILEIKDVNLTIINDPLPILRIEGAGQTDLAGPIQLTARIHRSNGESGVIVETPAIPVGPVLVQRLAMFAPHAA